MGIYGGTGSAYTGHVRHSQTRTENSSEVLFRRHRSVALHHGFHLRGQRHQRASGRRMDIQHAIELCASSAAPGDLSDAPNPRGSGADAYGVYSHCGRVSQGKTASRIVDGAEFKATSLGKTKRRKGAWFV